MVWFDLVWLGLGYAMLIRLSPFRRFVFRSNPVLYHTAVGDSAAPHHTTPHRTVDDKLRKIQESIPAADISRKPSDPAALGNRPRALARLQEEGNQRGTRRATNADNEAKPVATHPRHEQGPSRTAGTGRPWLTMALLLKRKVAQGDRMMMILRQSATRHPRRGRGNPPAWGR